MSIIEQAKTELAAINFDEDDTRVMIEILEKFFDQWDSGGAVHAVAPILMRCIAGKPLAPLTGADDEWFQPMDGMDVWQNRRCSSVFKERSASGELVCFDINASPPPDADPVFLADKKRVRHPIAFPYWPDQANVPSPIVEIEVS